MSERATRIVLERGDLTQARVDAIVNAANEGLRAGGGVCGAIFRAGGPQIARATDRLRAERGGCATGDAVATAGGDLPARWVVHAVGPVWRGGGEGEALLLASCHRRALAVAAEAGARTIAFPAISTGIYGYPVEAAARVALRAALDFAGERPEAFDEIRFVLFSDRDREVFAAALAELEAGR
jgi:O-acetyl-ADP-ribose deacetylase (regulator of RNase III)